MRKHIFSFLPAVLLMGTGCISIGTHEKQMRDCRTMQATYKDLQDKNSLLEKTNADLQEQLRNQVVTQQQLEGEIFNIRNTYDDLISELKDDIAGGSVQVASKGDNVIITLGDQILFKSGQSELQAKGARVLTSVADVLKKVKGREIHVEGYTDNVRISGALKDRFPSNWELSAMRAAAVVRQLEKKGVDPDSMMVMGFGEHRPLGDNATPSGRKINRRVEITVVKPPKT